MAELFTLEFDSQTVIAALDRLSDDLLERHTKPAARITADNVQREASARLRRQLSPHATGQTLAGISVREDFERAGYIVVSERQHMPNLPLWLDAGTKHMSPRDYFYSSARLEEGDHERRMLHAIVSAIEEAGFGV